MIGGGWVSEWSTSASTVIAPPVTRLAEMMNRRRHSTGADVSTVRASTHHGCTRGTSAGPAVTTVTTAAIATSPVAALISLGGTRSPDVGDGPSMHAAPLVTPPSAG